jgi:2-keto-4-pentenoate hydratase/2-oxohepta-3-ene-1,7-dioic acid hydratase in catechol pathway
VAHDPAAGNSSGEWFSGLMSEGDAMLWCRFEKNGKASYGVVEEGGIRAVTGVPWGEHSVSDKRQDMAGVKLLVPVIPPTFYAIGSNYHNHIVGRAEVKGTKPKFYDRPRVGYRANSALIAHGENIVKPRDAGPEFQYEAELVAVIGRSCRRATPEQAMECVFGWTIGNDVTERTWQRDDPTNMRGKNADTFKPMGPYIATGVDYKAMRTDVRLNGKTLHSFATGNMLFTPGEVIAEISRYNTLSPGDVVWLGTDEVPIDMNPGDSLEIDITGIGTLANKVVGE